MEPGLQPGIFKIMQALYLKFNCFNTCFDLALFTCFNLISSLDFIQLAIEKKKNNNLLLPFQKCLKLNNF